MTLPNGYEMQTTFVQDFAIADCFGPAAVEDTFNRAFAEWKNEPVYLTELVIVLNHGIWRHYETNPKLAEVYNRLWEKADEYACTHLKGEALTKFYQATD